MTQSIRNKKTQERGFTLIETLVAITILTIAVAAPLTLAAQSLMSAYTARDQVTAFHLAQEAIETVRAQRDHNLLTIIKTGEDTDGLWLQGLEVEERDDITNEIAIQKPFMVDSISIDANFIPCSGTTGSSCENLSFNDAMGFYGHEEGSLSRFKRFVRITEVANTNEEEVTVRAEVQWRAGALGTVRSVVVEENLFKWIAGVSN